MRDTEEAEKYRKIRVAELLKHTWCFEAVESDISIEKFMERELISYRLERITTGNKASFQGSPTEALTSAYFSEYGLELPFRVRKSMTLRSFPPSKALKNKTCNQEYSVAIAQDLEYKSAASCIEDLQGFLGSASSGDPKQKPRSDSSNAISIGGDELT